MLPGWARARRLACFRHARSARPWNLSFVEKTYHKQEGDPPPRVDGSLEYIGSQSGYGSVDDARDQAFLIRTALTRTLGWGKLVHGGLTGGEELWA